MVLSLRWMQILYYYYDICCYVVQYAFSSFLHLIIKNCVIVTCFLMNHLPHKSFFSFFNKLFIYFWLRWVFVAVRGLSLVAVSGGYSSLWCAGFSLRWLLLLRSTGSRRAGFSSCDSWGFSSCGSQALERRLGSCGARA